MKAQHPIPQTPMRRRTFVKRLTAGAALGLSVPAATRMATWDAATRQRFIDAEAALVNRQLALASGGNVLWTGWRNIGKGAFADYGRLLVEGQFEAIVELTQQL